MIRTEHHWSWQVGAPTLFLLIWIVVLYQKAGVVEKLTHRPTGEHFWAQTDRASMALTYYQDDAPFLLPRCHRARKGEEGITAGEFPAIPYLVSQMYRTWGFNELYFRLTVLIISLIGFLFSYLLMAKLLNSYWWAALSTSLWLASPNIILYSFSFLPDLPSLTFAVLALYALKHRNGPPSRGALLCFALFATLSGLLKLTGLAVALAAGAGFMIADVHHLRKQWKQWLPALIVPVLCVLVWVLYARHLLDEYRVFTFLLEPLPPTSWQQFSAGLTDLYNLRQMYYAHGFWWFILPAMLLAFIFRTAADRPLRWVIAFMSVVFAMFFVVLFEKSPHHMYYWLPFQWMILLILGWIFNVFDVRIHNRWVSAVVFVLGSVLVNYGAIHVHKNVRDRWKIGMETYRLYYDLDKELIEHGIDRNARILSYPDPTPNGTLYLMNRKGYTLSAHSSETEIRYALQQCDHAVVADSALVSNPTYKAYFYRPIGLENGLTIYSLHALKRTDR